MRRHASARSSAPPSLRLVAPLLAAAALLGPLASPSAQAEERPRRALAGLAPLLEGTWELDVMRLPDGRELRPPVAEGTIVIDGSTYLAAAYVLAGPERKVGSLWQGELAIERPPDGADSSRTTWTIRPRAGFRYDSSRTPPARPGVPPETSGTLSVEPDGVAFRRADGSTTRWLRAGRRVQQDPDGTVIEHVRTSLVPRVPDDLPGHDAAPKTPGDSR